MKKRMISIILVLCIVIMGTSVSAKEKEVLQYDEIDLEYLEVFPEYTDEINEFVKIRNSKNDDKSNYAKNEKAPKIKRQITKEKNSNSYTLVLFEDNTIMQTGITGGTAETVEPQEMEVSTMSLYATGTGIEGGGSSSGSGYVIYTNRSVYSRTYFSDFSYTVDYVLVNGSKDSITNFDGTYDDCVLTFQEGWPLTMLPTWQFFQQKEYTGSPAEIRWDITQALTFDPRGEITVDSWGWADYKFKFLVGNDQAYTILDVAN